MDNPQKTDPEKIGRYLVSRQLGRGGFAVVYLANDPFVKRQVAVKVLPAQFTDTPEMRARFQQEAEIIAALEHPAIVPIYDYGDHQGQPYIVMRHMAGGSLAERIQKGAMPVHEAAKILERISSALDRAHHQGIIHRDLKPGNILFDQFGDAYLSDFGIARLTEASLKLTGGGIIGTPAYMSPEQIYGDRPIDGRSDIYALGVIFFEMLTGTVPYEADTPAKLMMKHILDPVPHLRTVKPDLAEGYENLLERAMAKEPDHRFPRASDFSSAITLLSPTKPAERPPFEKTPAVQQPPSDTGVEAPGSPKPWTTDMATAVPGEDTVIAPPTPPEPAEYSKPTQIAPAAETVVKQDEEILPSVQQLEPPTAAARRPAWFAPGLIAVGALVIVCLLAAFAISRSGLFDQSDSAENTNTAQTTSTDNSSEGNDSDLAGSNDSIPLEPAGEANSLPQAAGILSISEIGQFQELARLGRGFLTGLDVNPEGTVLAAGSGIGIWLYDTETMEPITLLEGHFGPVNDVVWSPDGRLLASAGQDTTVKIWEPENQSFQTFEGHQELLHSVAWSGDGRYVASGGYDTAVRIWDVETGQSSNVLLGHEAPVWMVSWPPDNNEWVASASEDQTVRVWDINSGEQLLLLPHEEIVRAVVWSIDGATLITASDDNFISVWDADSGELLNQWTAHEYGMKTMALSPDGLKIATTGYDGLIRIWEWESGRELGNWSGDNNGPFTPAWLPDSQHLAVAFDNNLLGIWGVDNPLQGRVTNAHIGQVGSLAWAPEGRLLVSGHSGDGRLRFWDMETLEIRTSLDGYGGDGNNLSWSANGRLLARPVVNIEVIDLSNGIRPDIEPVFSGSEDIYYNAVSLSPNGEQVAGVNWGGNLGVWNLTDQQAIFEVNGAGPQSVAWSPDGTLLATPADGQPAVIIWDSQTGESLKVIPTGSEGIVTTIDWSPDGLFLAGVDTAGTVNVWERETWGVALTFQSFGTSLNSLDWSPDGRWLAAGSWSNSLYIWDVTGPSGADPVLYIDLAHSGPVVAVAWSPDSTTLATGSHDGTIKIWGVE